MSDSHNHTHECTDKCCCGHDHEHGHEHEHPNEMLFGKENEVPGVFSHSFEIQLKEEVSAQELSQCLTGWLESLTQWIKDSKYYIGHIKIFAEKEDLIKLWISTTGKQINVKGLEACCDSKCTDFVINITAIVFGVKEKVLQEVATSSLVKELRDRLLAWK